MATLFPLESMDRLVELAANGIVTSIAYGPVSGGHTAWTVTCRTRDLETFERQYHVRDTAHDAVQVAYDECLRRGWLL